MINKSKIKLILLWLLINCILAGVLFLIFSVNPALRTHIFFWSTMITTNMVGYSCAATSIYISRKTKSIKTIKRPLLILIGSLCAAAIAGIISFYVSRFLLNYPSNINTHDLTFKLIITIVISAVVTVISIVIGRLKETKDELQKNLNDCQENYNSESSINNSLSVKEDEIYHIIEHSDLIYLSSHGKKTTLHTIGKDYVTNQLLKDIVDKLPESFIRIHKQFIVNTKYLSKIKYYEGGRYLAYLKDDDESTLPVSKKKVPLLKEKLGI